MEKKINIVQKGLNWKSPNYVEINIKEVRIIAKCVAAAGGVALLCSVFLPGALMIFMGYQMNSGAKETAKEKLLQEGWEMSD